MLDNSLSNTLKKSSSLSVNKNKNVQEKVKMTDDKCDTDDNGHKNRASASKRINHNHQFYNVLIVNDFYHQ